MAIVVVLALAAFTLWTLCGVGIALLAGRIIHARDQRDRPRAGARSTERAGRHHVFS